MYLSVGKFGKRLYSSLLAVSPLLKNRLKLKYGPWWLLYAVCTANTRNMFDASQTHDQTKWKHIMGKPKITWKKGVMNDNLQFRFLHKYIYYPRCTCKQAINYILLFIWHYKLQTVREILVNWWWWQMHKSFGQWIELYFGWIENDKKKELPHAHSHHNASSVIAVMTPISLLTASFQMKLIMIISM